MKLRINGEDREVVDNLSLKDLVTQLNLTPERIAIELNQAVVRRPDWPATVLQENDRLEIVHFVGGGTGKQEAGAVGRRQAQDREVPVSIRSPAIRNPESGNSLFLFARIRV